MRGGNILDPPQINGVVNVILLVDVGCNHRDDHFEMRGRHQKSGQRRLKKTFNAERPTSNV